MPLPILYSFRRCPYAIRARLGVASAGVQVELREVVLRDKPRAFLETSPSATVPCLDANGRIIDESLDIMLWALGQSDPEGLMDMPETGFDLIATNDGPFKTALDRYKYTSRHPERDRDHDRAQAAKHLAALDRQLDDHHWLFGAEPRLADFAILPFVRQFAFVDKTWFYAQDWPALAGWLDRFIGSQRFISAFAKIPQWKQGDPVNLFP
ncbi:glutathione S-transferase [Shimia biformata]|uniref:glutathione S-transferase n=1 Tax=Shimia biformata TaxID=1294299 RepID=UPI001951D1A3|nr:glutathione S-transferase [Shimia biformata]